MAQCEWAENRGQIGRGLQGDCSPSTACKGLFALWAAFPSDGLVYQLDNQACECRSNSHIFVRRFLERIVSKRKDSRYSSRRSPHWIKLWVTRVQTPGLGGIGDDFYFGYIRCSTGREFFGTAIAGNARIGRRAAEPRQARRSGAARSRRQPDDAFVLAEQDAARYACGGGCARAGGRGSRHNGSPARSPVAVYFPYTSLTASDEK
jgi:hypothetical protein